MTRIISYCIYLPDHIGKRTNDRSSITVLTTPQSYEQFHFRSFDDVEVTRFERRNGHSIPGNAMPRVFPRVADGIVCYTRFETRKFRFGCIASVTDGPLAMESFQATNPRSPIASFRKLLFTIRDVYQYFRNSP
jgi:hypothetical protein